MTRFEEETVKRLAAIERALGRLSTQIDLLLQSESIRNTRLAAMDGEVKSNRERISSLFAVVGVPVPEPER